MSSRNTEKIVLAAIFVGLLISGCKSTVEKLAISTCRTVETNISRCSQIIADDISDKNANTLSSVNEGEL
ncbi:MAG: hypothetical protein CML36_05060 [Rhodobacteraceae bacterium]|nr:hypothetical protein [Paracoccaceae bacterium]